MAVTLAPDIDLNEATQKIKSWEDEMEEQLNLHASIQFDGEKLSRGAQLIAKEFGGLGGKIADTLGLATDLAEVGASFAGPWGAAAGAIAGGIIKIAQFEKEAREAAEALQRDLKAGADETKRFVDEFRRLDALNAGGALDAVQAIGDEIRSKREEISKLSGDLTAENVARINGLEQEISVLMVKQIEATRRTHEAMHGDLKDLGKALNQALLPPPSLKELETDAVAAMGDLGALKIEHERLLIQLAKKPKGTALTDLLTDLEKVEGKLSVAESIIQLFRDAEEKDKEDRKRRAKERADTEKKAAEDAQKYTNDLARASLEWQKQLDAEREAEILYMATAEVEAARRTKDILAAYDQGSFNTWLSYEQKRLDFLANEEIQRQALAAQAIDSASAQAQAYVNALAPLAGTLGSLFDSVAENVANNEDAFKDLGKTARGALSDLLKQYARKWALLAVESASAGFAALGNPLTVAFAPPNFKAAAGYAAAAAAAGVGGVALGKGTGAGAGGGTGSSSGGGSSPSLGKAANTGPTVQTPSIIHINVQTLAPGDQDTWEQIGAAAARGLEAHVSAGGKVRFS
jgi:hypothetical protein